MAKFDDDLDLTTATDGAVPTASAAGNTATKRRYEPPTVSRVGNLEDLTLGVGGVINDLEGSQGG
jgi:hypothetical protein